MDGRTLQLATIFTAATLTLGFASAGCAQRETGAGVLPAGIQTGIPAQGQRRTGGLAVTTLNDSGPGSLRAAITAANASHSRDSRIMFSVDGSIKLASDLPPMISRVNIDGTSAPAYGGTPTVEIDANGHSGLVFAPGSSGSKLFGIAIVKARGNGVTLEAGAITINLDFVGLDLDGAAAGNGGDGIHISSQSSNDRIGFNASGASGAIANVISANAGDGISLHGSSANVIAANRIGTDVKGKIAMPNGGNGILLTDGSSANEIGGKRFTDSGTGEKNNPTGSKGTVPPVFVVPPDGNLISGNDGDGILIEKGSSQNVLNGNFIGTTADGDGTIANLGDGVGISLSNENSLSGCKFVNDPFVYYNVVSGNRQNGVRITSSNNVVVQGNFFGVGANNSTIVANGRDGILIDGSSQNTQVGGVIPLGNVSAGNIRNGIEVAGTAAGFITFNTFGGLLAFKGAAPNGNDGLLITATGGNQTVRTNVFSGNMNDGVEIGGDASGVTVGPDIIGLSTKGDSSLPNGGNGVVIGGTAHGNVVGDSYHSVIPQNTFSGNLGYGVVLTAGAHDNRIINTFIGTNVLGALALANRKGGIMVGANASHNVIGGLSDDPKVPAKNLISGNGGNGVTLAAGSSYTTVANNWIGLTRSGERKLPNNRRPIVVRPGSVHNKISGNKT